MATHEMKPLGANEEVGEYGSDGSGDGSGARTGPGLDSRLGVRVSSHRLSTKLLSGRMSC